MRKRIVGLGAAAAVMVSGGSKGDTRDWVRRASAGSAATIKQLPILLQATMVANRFANAKSVEEFKEAEAIWIILRPNLAKYETSLGCKDYGASHDKEIASDLVEELAKKPTELIMDVGRLILSLAGGEKDESLEALKDAMKDLLDHVKDKGVEKVKNAIEKSAVRERLTDRLKETLLRYLQSKLKRSRKYCLQLIADVGSIAEAYGGLAIKVGAVALAPSRINPDECGSEKWIEHERESALRRVFSSSTSERSSQERNIVQPLL